MYFNILHRLRNKKSSAVYNMKEIKKSIKAFSDVRASEEFWQVFESGIYKELHSRNLITEAQLNILLKNNCGEGRRQRS